MSQIGTLKTVEDFEEAAKETPHFYLVHFVTGDNQHGSLVMATKEPIPLWRVYAIANETNKERNLITILGVSNLSV